VRGEDIFYYITIMNEPYAQPALPPDSREGILRGLYRVRAAAAPGSHPRVHLLGSGAILNEVLKGATLLAERYGVDAEVWSATSYKELQRDALTCERWSRLHPEAPPRVSHVAACLGGDRPAPVIAASDYVKALPATIAPWVPGPFTILGTDGFGRSDGREALRRFFEVDAAQVAVAALAALARQGSVAPAVVAGAIRDLGIDPESADPVTR
jgi:pyruvate dehydrogenase E1 component